MSIVGEAGEVAAGGLGAALDDVAGDDRAGQRVEVVAAPAVVGDRRADDHRRVGDPAGDDDVGTLVQRLGDAERTEVGVGGEHVAELELVGALAQVVTFDVGDDDVDALLGGDLPELLREPGRVESTGVGDDLDALLLGEGQAVGHLPDERLGVAGRRVLHHVATEDEHRQLGEVVAGQVVELAALEHLAHRRQAVAVVAGAVPDPHGTHGLSSVRRSGSLPGSPANAWTIVSQWAASSPSAWTSTSSTCRRRVASSAKS